MMWKSNWIWDNSDLHSRNYWLCFRKTFQWEDIYDQINMHITADSKYILFINGQRVGFGPVRSWDFEYSYDTYDIRNYLVKGKNTIAILVVHHGVSTFQYVEGEAGLLSQIEFLNNGCLERVIKSDSTWKVAAHEGYEQNTFKISAQQAWAEIYDATRFDANWMKIGFNDSQWHDATVIRKQEKEEGRCLVERDIPFLACNPVYAKKIRSFREVESVKNAISINLRNCILRDVHDANKRELTAYILLKINSPKFVSGKLRFPFTEWQSPRGKFKINGREYLFPIAHREVDIELDQGINIFMMDISGIYHEYCVRMAFDLPTNLEFCHISHNTHSRCFIVGPFSMVQHFDTGFNVEKGETIVSKVYQEFWDIDHTQLEKELQQYNRYCYHVPDKYIQLNDAYITSTMKTVIREREGNISNCILPNLSYAEIFPVQKDDLSILEIVIDFGKELSGFVEFDLETNENVQIDFYFFEYMKKEVLEHTCDLDNTLRYYTKKGRQYYRSPIRRGFRYVMLTIQNHKSPIKLYSVVTQLCTYAVCHTGDFNCSDFLLNKIWDISAYTTELCMEDTYVDCPAYEQTFWTGDSRNESLVNYYVFGSYEISKRCLLLTEKSSKITEFLMDQVPSGWQSIIPDWTFFWVMACREYYQFTKDEDFLLDIYPKILKVIHAYSKLINKDGLLEFTGWNLLDWAAMDTPDSGVITHENAAFVKAIEDVTYIANRLNDSKEVHRLKELRQEIIVAINKYLWCENKKAYIDCIHTDGRLSTTISQQTNILIYLYDCYTLDRKQHVENIILNQYSESKEIVQMGSPFISFFYLEALVKMNKVELAVDYMRDKWGQMLRYGATTCWEMFPGFMPDRLTRSHCHAWSAAPGYFLGVLILGVKLLNEGTVLISPQPCGLQWANGSVPTPYGTIDIEWSICERKMDIYVKKPSRISYKVEIDKEKWLVEEVWLNNVKIM